MRRCLDFQMKDEWPRLPEIGNSSEWLPDPNVQNQRESLSFRMPMGICSVYVPHTLWGRPGFGRRKFPSKEQQGVVTSAFVTYPLEEDRNLSYYLQISVACAKRRNDEWNPTPVWRRLFRSSSYPEKDHITLHDPLPSHRPGESSTQIYHQQLYNTTPLWHTFLKSVGNRCSSIAAGTVVWNFWLKGYQFIWMSN